MGRRSAVGRAQRWTVRLAVLGLSAAGARLLRDRAVAANTLRYDHVLDFSKPFLGDAPAADRLGPSR